jgi:hypothetical protein
MALGDDVQPGGVAGGRGLAAALTLAPTEPAEPKTRRARGPKAFDPDHVELAVLEATMAELHRCRALAGWKAREWTVSAAHCGELLARLREDLSIHVALDSVRATVWLDARADTSQKVGAKLAAGEHANLTRIFRPTKGNKVERWIDEWKHAGKPDPSPPIPTVQRGGAFTPRGEYETL